MIQYLAVKVKKTYFDPEHIRFLTLPKEKKSRSSPHFAVIIFSIVFIELY